ncbi:DUF4255 domain-containing protein [Caballeronia ptereochthonis]|uniref:Pvc16 N-terminal domain-containing protein n=1 Tax=Caballeronia ptereochthonis TaxID=1777144 RepID=A0A158DYH0_9BURK|nr:DUF4255 domain-containing protein [Caballeronia ptereochthonis]SAK99669.1 hypothetical protein AWB83_06120 [Caballeronia ptereochthonis]
MSARAIYLVTNAIEARLKTALSAAGRPGDTTFVGPLDDPSASNAALVLFLYRVTTSDSLRNTEHRLAGVNLGDPEQVFLDALPLDLHYMITVGPRDKAGESESLRLLGFALQALNDAQSLTGSQVEGEVVRVSVVSAGSDELSHVWALFPTVNYRTSVLYMASPVWIDPAAAAAASPGVAVQDVASGQLN